MSWVLRAFTLLELVVVCAILGIIAAVAAPKTRALMDALAVEAASRDVANAFALGRLAALRYGGAEVRLDSFAVVVRAQGRVVHQRAVASAHGVRMRVNTSLVRYAATGIATGLSNGSVIISRGAAADTVVVSRLGRVRR